MQVRDPQPFEAFLSFFALVVLSPILMGLGAALGGLIVQATVGAWVVEGASYLGVKLPPDRLWAVSVALAYLGSYFRMALGSKILRVESGK